MIITENKAFQDSIIEFTNLPKETEWIEFKHNDIDPIKIGEYISALSNSGALIGEPFVYIIWGIEDKTHKIIGTKFKPKDKKYGNEELENWLLRNLEPRIDFSIQEGNVYGKTIVLFKIQAAFERPVRFKGMEFIRIGSYKKKAARLSRKTKGNYGKCLINLLMKKVLLWKIILQIRFYLY